MKYKFLLHSLSHTTLAINVTGLSLNVAGVGVNGSSLPFVQYNSWDRAKQRFLELGAQQESLDAAYQHLRATSVAVLTIM
jgi:hypothetical protein